VVLNSFLLRGFACLTTSTQLGQGGVMDGGEVANQKPCVAARRVSKPGPGRSRSPLVPLRAWPFRWPSWIFTPGPPEPAGRSAL